MRANSRKGKYPHLKGEVVDKGICSPRRNKVMGIIRKALRNSWLPSAGEKRSLELKEVWLKVLSKIRFFHVVTWILGCRKDFQFFSFCPLLSKGIFSFPNLMADTGSRSSGTKPLPHPAWRRCCMGLLGITTQAKLQAHTLYKKAPA